MEFTVPTTMPIQFTDKELVALRAHLEESKANPEYVQSAYEKLVAAMAPDVDGHSALDADE